MPSKIGNLLIPSNDRTNTLKKLFEDLYPKSIAAFFRSSQSVTVEETAEGKHDEKDTRAKKDEIFQAIKLLLETSAKEKKNPLLQHMSVAITDFFPLEIPIGGKQVTFDVQLGALAAICNDEKLIKLLDEYGFDIGNEKYGPSAYFVGCICGATAAVEYLMRKKSTGLTNPFAYTYEDTTYYPLKTMFECNQPQSLRFLLARASSDHKEEINQVIQLSRIAEEAPNEQKKIADNFELLKAEFKILGDKYNHSSPAVYSGGNNMRQRWNSGLAAAQKKISENPRNESVKIGLAYACLQAAEDNYANNDPVVMNSQLLQAMSHDEKMVLEYLSFKIQNANIMSSDTTSTFAPRTSCPFLLPFIATIVPCYKKGRKVFSKEKFELFEDMVLMDLRLYEPTESDRSLGYDKVELEKFLNDIIAGSGGKLDSVTKGFADLQSSQSAVGESLRSTSSSSVNMSIARRLADPKIKSLDDDESSNVSRRNPVAGNANLINALGITSSMSSVPTTSSINSDQPITNQPK